jgi:hypothetical protein
MSDLKIIAPFTLPTQNDQKTPPFSPLRVTGVGYKKNYTIVAKHKWESHCNFPQESCFIQKYKAGTDH